MTGEDDKRRVLDLLRKLLELEGEERTQFLDRACEDSELRKKLESMVELESEAEGLLAKELAEELASKIGARRPAMDQLRGLRFDDYEIVEKVGQGAMGVVYKARQVTLDRIVALKLLAPFHGESGLTRFLDEARFIAKLGHPNIVEIYQVGRCDFGYYFSMKFIEGETLDSLLQAGALSVHRALKILTRVALAVDYAHGKGVIHRDLKPANIMIDAFGRPIVMDFGLARLARGSSRRTGPGVGLGTPAYMPPEQAGDSPEKVGPRSDVYSLGGVVYTVLTGRPPYQAETALATLVKVQSPEMPAPIHMYQPDVPEELEKICMKCLAKDPGDRFSSAAELADELRRVLNTFASTTKGLKPPSRARGVRLVEKSSGKAHLMSGASFVIGRTNSCNVVLAAGNVSKRHCRLLRDEDGLRVEDLGSANGTYVNGQRITESSEVAAGDILRIGRQEFVLEVDDEESG